MIEALIALIKAEIGTEIGNLVYSTVVPVNSAFPCVLLERTRTLPYHTKDSTGRKETTVMCTVFAKESDTTDSAFSVSFDLSARLVASINGVISNGTEYRVMDIITDYEDEVGAFKATIELVIQSDF